MAVEFFVEALFVDGFMAVRAILKIGVFGWVFFATAVADFLTFVVNAGIIVERVRRVFFGQSRGFVGARRFVGTDGLFGWRFEFEAGRGRLLFGFGRVGNVVVPTD